MPGALGDLLLAQAALEAQRAQAGADEFVGLCHIGMTILPDRARAANAGRHGLRLHRRRRRTRGPERRADSRARPPAACSCSTPGEPRNHAAHAMHGVLGHDGLAPAALRARGIEELGRYGIEVRAAEVSARAADRRRRRDRRHHRADADPRHRDARRRRRRSRASTRSTASARTRARTATAGSTATSGSRSSAPAFAGVHMGPLLRQWSPDVMVFSAGIEPEDEADARRARRRGRERAGRALRLRRRRTPARRSSSKAASRSSATRCSSTSRWSRAPRSAATLGCALEENGFVTAAPEDRQTSVDRVYAAGNCADPMQNVPMAIADGARAGVAVNVRLIGARVWCSRSDKSRRVATVGRSREVA